MAKGIRMTVGPHWRAREVSVHWVKKVRGRGMCKLLNIICIVYLGTEHFIKEICSVINPVVDS